MIPNQTNYQRELERILDGIKAAKTVPTLLLHSCCAPCSSYCLAYLAEYFRITILYFNPNISPREEYDKRVREQQRLIRELPVRYVVSFVEGEYRPESFLEIARGREELSEGGERCFDCYELRLREAAWYAKQNAYDYFATTLSVSPHKNAQKLNEIGLLLQEEYGVDYLVSDFKKRGGYQKSIEMSREYNLYRQDYCGCVYSKRARDKRKSCDMEAFSRGEMWDIYDGDGMLTGRVMERGLPKAGDYMLCVHVYIYNSKKEFLVQKRAKVKESHPGEWDITGGAVLSGEESREGAVRETLEEIGVSLVPEELHYLGRLKRKQKFIDFYFVRKEIDLKSCTLQKNEVEQIRFVNREELLRLAKESRHRDASYIAKLQECLDSLHS